jgi:type IV pilus assembly protein PilM
LYRRNGGPEARVLYLNVDGLTNLAIAEGSVCRFTRVVGGGFEGMAGELAARRGIAIADARELLGSVDLREPAEVLRPEPTAAEQASPLPLAAEQPPPPTPVLEPASAGGQAEQDVPLPVPPTASDADVRGVLENGIREIAGEVRNSLDFHRSQDGGGEVGHVVLSGSALALPGFAEALQASLGVEVQAAAVGLADQSLSRSVSAYRLAVAAGLATSEVDQ